MTTYDEATLRTTAPVAVPGAGAAPYDTVVDSLMSSVETDLETYANLYLTALTAGAVYAPAGIGAAGMGMGDMATVSILGVDDDDFVPLTGPYDGGSATHGGHFFIYKASDEHELDVQFAACRARIAAWIDGQAGATGHYIDHHVVGCKHGGFVGVFFIWRSVGQPV